jgi:integrase
MKRRYPKYCRSFLDRHGTVRTYFRRGNKNIPLPGLPWSPTFMAAYEQALNSQVDLTIKGPNRTKPGSVDAALIGYYQSDDFKEEGGLAKATQQNRRAILENFRNECGTFPLKSPYLGQGLQTIINRKTPAAQRNFKKAMRGFIKYCLSHNLMKVDPLAGLGKLKTMKTKGHHTVTEDEIKQYRDRHPPGTKARLGFELLYQTGHARAEVVRMGPQHVKNGVLRMKRQKTGVEFVIPLLPELLAELDRHPKSNLAYLISERGTPYTAQTFGDRFRVWCKEAGLVGCSPHGLRKAAAVRLAEKLGTAPELMAWFGWKTITEAQRYIEEANKIKLAENAANKMRTGTGNPMDPGCR